MKSNTHQEKNPVSGNQFESFNSLCKFVILEGKYGRDVFQKAIIERGGECQRRMRMLFDDMTTEEMVKARKFIQVQGDCRSGPELISDIEGKGFEVSPTAQILMKRKDFRPYSDLFTLGVIYGDEVKRFIDRRSSVYRSMAFDRGWGPPPPVCGPLLRKYLTNKDLKKMGVHTLVVMHRPIIDDAGNQWLFSISLHGKGNLRVGRPGPSDHLAPGVALLFEVPNQEE